MIVNCLAILVVIFLVYYVEGTVTVIKGGGTTFPQQPYFSAVADFNQLYQGVQATYNATNSQTGQQSVASGLLNWGGSDTDVQTSIAGSDKIVVLPAIAGGLLIAYNLPGYSDTLKLSRKAFPRIFDGKIQKWNDPMIVKDNPFLANNSASIRVVRQVASKGSSVNLSKFLIQLDAENGISPSPHSNPQTLQSIPSSLLAKNPAAINVMVGAIPNTIGYLNQYEAQDAMLPSDSTVKAALIQHKDGSFIRWSGDTVKIAVTGIPDAVVQNASLQTNLIAYNLPVKGAYPLSLISNFVLNPTNISSNPLEIVGTLKLLWMFLQSPQYANQYTYTSLTNTTMGFKTLNFLKTIKYSDGTPIYGQSICDVDVDGSYKNPCVHGHCIDPLPFQAPDQVCVCDNGYQNVMNTDCSEPTPLFMPGFVSNVQIALFVIATLVIIVFAYFIVVKRNEPDVKAISPFCCSYILVGCFIGTVAILTKGLSTTNSVCHANAVLPAVAFGMIFSMILAKAIRIFLIFGYSKIARSRFLKDDFLIACCTAVAVFEGAFTGKAMDGAGIEPSLITFDGSSDTLWACASDETNVDAAKQLFGGIFGFNAVLLVLCIWMGWMTRKASEKFDESKKVGVVISISALFIVLDLAVNFGIPQQTKAMFNVRLLFDSCTIFLIATATPVVLFFKALGFGGGQKDGNITHNSSEVNSSHIDQNDGLVKTYMFHTGLKLNRPTSLWKTAVFLVMPDLDILIILSEGNNGTHTLSQSNIKIIEKTTAAAKSKTEECIELLLGANKTCYLVEFPHKAKMDEFRMLRATPATISASGMTKTAHGKSFENSPKARERAKSFSTHLPFPGSHRTSFQDA